MCFPSAGQFGRCGIRRLVSHVKGFLIGRPLVFGQEMMGLDQYHAVYDLLKEYGSGYGCGFGASAADDAAD